MPYKISSRVAISAWLALMLCCAIYSANRIHSGGAFESNILNFIPDSDTSLSANEERNTPLFDNAELQGKFTILLSHPEVSIAEQHAHQLRDELSLLAGISLEQSSDALDELAQFYAPYTHQLLSADNRSLIENLDSAGYARSTIEGLYSPIPGPRPYRMAEDPFNLGGDWLTNIWPEATSFSPGEITSLREQGNTWYILRGEVTGSPFAIENQNVARVVSSFQQTHQTTEILSSGVVFHAAEATAIARKEISLVGVGSLLGIILLVVMIFRSLTALAAISITIICSILAAITGSFLVFGSVHLITLAFGSTLLGLAVDYCFHFLLNYRRTGNSSVAGKLIARGLALSVGSSLLAYLVQLLSPFPGIQQFAVFICFGLVAAGCTVGLLALCYTDKRLSQRSGQLWLFENVFEKIYATVAIQKKSLLFTLAVAALGLIFLCYKSEFNDDIRLLNASSEELLQSENQVRQLLGGIDTQRYWVVTGNTSEQLLQRTETIARELGNPVLTLSNFVPSLNLQRANYDLTSKKLYSSEGALRHFCSQLDIDCAIWGDQTPAFAAGLTLENLPENISNYFSSNLLIGDDYHLVFPYNNSSQPLTEPKLSGEGDWLFKVDEVERISDSLSLFRVEVTSLLFLFLTLLGIIVFWLYRTKGLLVFSSVLLSLLVGITFSSHQAITLFHIMALLLVMGISLDSAFFYLELGLNTETWLASTMSMATSILAFGLLSLSQVTVLNQFGSVVFYGLLCAWLVTPIIFKTQELAINTHRNI